jgi:hypothetical protein
MRDSNIKGYLVYRTDDQAKIGDWRRMDLLPNPSVGYSFKVLDMPPEPSPAEHSYLDEPVKPQVPYYYGLVAIRQEESGTRYMSELSAIRVGQAVDMRIPEPPVPEVVWESSDSGALSAQITWSSADETLLQRRARDLGQWRSLTEWLTPGAHIYHDYATDPTKSYDYRLWARRDTMSAAMIGNSAQLHSVQ